MEVVSSAHVDTFSHDHLPARETWPDLLFELADLTYPPALNCGAALLDLHVDAGRGGDRCIVTDTETWTYGELKSTADAIAHHLVGRMGLVPGNRVLLRGPNNPLMVAAWFAVVRAGGVVITTMHMLRAGELRVMADIAQIQFALSDSRFMADLEEAAISGLAVATLEEAAAEPRQHFVPIETAADDVAMIAFTSGTTGRPKATMHFHRDVLAIADTFSANLLRPVADDVFTGSAPLGFTFGLGAIVIFPMRVGAAMYLMEQPNPERILDAVMRHGVTVLSTAPTAYRAMIPLILALGAERGLGSLRACISAGETLPRATWTAFHDATGIGIIDGIGSTEMLHIFISAAGDDIRPGTTGRAVPGYVAEVQDDDGTPVPDGHMGRLAVKGPTGCRYLHGDRQDVYVRNGWNMTGDIYVRNAEGYFTYQARADDMIISSGYNIAGPEVENALLRHPSVAETAVVGVPDEARGMLVKAFVVLAQGTSPTDSLVGELQDFVKGQIAPYKYPRVIEFVSELPRTNTGKLQRFRLRQPS